MSTHRAPPTKTDILHILCRRIQNHLHEWIVFCKHMIAETTAGILAIVIWESQKFNLEHPVTTVAIGIFHTFV